MLDLQRKRSSAHGKANVHLARIVVILHLIAGALVASIFLFHELFIAAISAALWYLISIGLVVGMCNFLQWCRVVLGLWFILGAGFAFAYLAWLPPAPDMAQPQPALALKLLPFWLSTIALGYCAGGILLLVSKRIERATMMGFSLWEARNDW